MSTQTTNTQQQTIPVAQPVEMSAELKGQIQLAQIEGANQFNLSEAGQQVAIIRARQDAELSLTPIGQDLKRHEAIQRIGQMYAASTLVPDTYKGNIANCAIAIDMANRLSMNPLMVMQNLYIVHGNPSWSSKFLIATINSCGRYTTLRYECNDKKGEEYGWRCVAYETADVERRHPLEGSWVTWKMVKAEGWDKKSGSKWLTMPEQMFRYRAAAFWQRMYAPEISLGFPTQDEAIDTAEPETVGYVDVQTGEVVEAPAKPRRRRTAAELAAERAVKTAAPTQPDPAESEVTKPDPQPEPTPAKDTPKATESHRDAHEVSVAPEAQAQPPKPAPEPAALQAPQPEKPDWVKDRERVAAQMAQHAPVTPANPQQ